MPAPQRRVSLRDAGATWRELTAIRPAKFGFAVAAHPRDPQTAWFVPAAKDERRIPVDGELVVARTSDGGESFEVLRRGLPQRHAYDLVYRHALDVDASGEVLAFGSTSGGCGSRKTAVICGTQSMRVCRRSRWSVSPLENAAAVLRNLGVVRCNNR